MPTAAPTPAPLAAPSPVADKATAIQTPPQPPPAAEKVRVRAHDRARNVRAKLEADESSTPAPAAERETEREAAPRGQGQARSSSAVDSDAEDTPERKPEPEKAAAAADAERRREERMARLRKAQERERADHEARAAKGRGRERDQELETLRKKLADLEPLNKAFSNEDAFLEAYEQRGWSPEKLAKRIREQLTDPTAIARQHAKTEADTVRTEITSVREELAALKRAQAEREANARAEQEGLAKTSNFLARAKGSSESHPLTVTFLKRHGDAGLVSFANQFIAPLLREDYDVQELHDHVEQLLDELQVGGASPTANPANGASPSQKTGAGQPTTTLSNAIASERGSVTEEIPLHLMPRSERVARLKQKLGGE